MIVVCVYKSGGDFTSEHVVALKAGLLKYMPCNFKFWCLTDCPGEVIDIADSVINLFHNLPGWWSKIELFRALYPMEQVIYFDLDVLILKELSMFVDVITENSTIMLRSADRVGKENDWPSSSIMSWYGNDLNDIYLQFIALGNVIEKSKEKISRAGQRTDQGFIGSMINPNKFQDYLWDNYILYKIEYLENPKLFEQAHILNWTGKPRYQDMPKEFKHIKDLWSKLITIEV